MRVKQSIGTSAMASWIPWYHWTPFGQFESKYIYTTYTNLNSKYLVMCKVQTDISCIELLYHGFPSVHVREKNSIKLVDYLHVQAEKHCIFIT